MRLSLRAGDSGSAGRWLEATRRADREATTESGIPIGVATGLLLSADRGACSWAPFVAETLQGLETGAWRLRAEQWIFYSAEIGAALRRCPARAENLIARTEATAARLRTLVDAYHRIVGARLAASGSSSPAEARYLAEIDSFVVLFPATRPEAGWIVEASRLTERAARRLGELVVAEDFAGRSRWALDRLRLDQGRGAQDLPP